MAVRGKTKVSLSPMIQETENATEDGLVMAAEAVQDLFVSSDSSGLLAADAENLPIDFNDYEQLAAGSSEVNMNANREIPEDQTSDEAIADDALEPEIILDANLSIQNVVKLYEKVKKAYAAYDAIEIDASHVASVDTSTLQLFVALKKDAVKQNKEVNFFQPSPRFIESARLLDLLDILEIIYV
jgi:anti-anti-sigma regulatory factor